jgi:hypothetical protein
MLLSKTQSLLLIKPLVVKNKLLVQVLMLQLLPEDLNSKLEK